MSKDLERDDFDDQPQGGGKKATEEDYKRVWLYMQSRQLNPSIRNIREALERVKFVPPSVATSQRWAKKLGLSEPLTASPIKEAETRQRRRRDEDRPVTVAEIAETTGKDAPMVERTLLTRMRELLKDENTSTQLAITENRTRMAFNVALMEFYAENPSLLANVKEAAAFLDATTIASKLSGGPSIDITLPKNGDDAGEISPSGHPMKTVGQSMANVDQSLLAHFREFQRNGAGT